MSSLMQRRLTTALACAALALLACEEKTLPTAPERLSALLALTTSADSLLADGLSELTLTATIRSDDPDPAKLEVQFRTTGGTLVGGTSAAPCAEASCIVVQADRATGIATARLRSSTTQGEVTVTAVLTAVGVRTSKVVQFTAGEAVLSFAGTSAAGEADGETAIRVVVRADARVAPGKTIVLSASNGSFVGEDGSVEVPLAADSTAEAQFRSLAAPGRTVLTATVQGQSLAPARYEIIFSAAFAAIIQVESSATTVEADSSLDLVAKYFREPGAGSVSVGLQPTWRADKVDDAGDVLAVDIGRLSKVTPVQADPADPSKRTSSATFEPAGLTAGDRVAITVTLQEGGASGRVVVNVE